MARTRMRRAPGNEAGAMWCETKYAPVDLDSGSREGVFSGYASLFGEVDMGRDRIAPGAFAKSLAVKPASRIRMLFQHNPDEPIGVWE